MIQRVEHPATSLRLFLSSDAVRRKYRELLNCGDAADQPGDCRGKPSWIHQKRIEREVGQAVDMIRGGVSMRETARRMEMPCSRLQQRLYSRGLTVDSIRKEAT